MQEPKWPHKREYLPLFACFQVSACAGHIVLPFLGPGTGSVCISAVFHDFAQIQENCPAGVKRETSVFYPRSAGAVVTDIPHIIQGGGHRVIMRFQDLTCFEVFVPVAGGAADLLHYGHRII